MKFQPLNLPSNRNFGFFFSTVFLILSAYFLYIQSQLISFLLVLTAFLFLITTLLNADLLLPLNKAWMRFGLLLGMIFSPIVLGIIFFGLITPYAIAMRIIGRDELRLKRKKRDSYWIERTKVLPQTQFNKQF